MHQDLTLHQLRLFLKVAELGSLTRAAASLSLPQPSVSRLVGRMESNVGVRLVERSGRGVALTAAGERFLEHAREAVHQHDLACSAAQDTRGRLIGVARIAAPELVADAVFLPLIERFRRAHPGASIRAIAAPSLSIPSLLFNDVVDIGVIADTHTAPATPLDPLFREDLYLIGPRGAAQLKGRTVKLERVARLPLILNAMQGGLRTVIDAAFAAISSAPDVRIEIDANGPLLDLVESGEGFAIMPYAILNQRRGPHGLGATRIVSPGISRRFGLAMAARRTAPAVRREAVREIHALVREHSRGNRWLFDG